MGKSNDFKGKGKGGKKGGADNYRDDWLEERNGRDGKGKKGGYKGDDKGKSRDFREPQDFRANEASEERKPRAPKVDVSKVAQKVTYEEGETWGTPEISKKLSWLLRRGAAAVGVDMDDDGWILISDVLKWEGLPPQLTLDRLMKVVEESNVQKLRYEVEGAGDSHRIRAAGEKTAASVSRSGDGKDRPWQPQRSRRPADSDDASNRPRAGSDQGLNAEAAVFKPGAAVAATSSGAPPPPPGQPTDQMAAMQLHYQRMQQQQMAYMQQMQYMQMLQAQQAQGGQAAGASGAKGGGQQQAQMMQQMQMQQMAQQQWQMQMQQMAQLQAQAQKGAQAKSGQGGQQ